MCEKQERTPDQGSGGVYIIKKTTPTNTLENPHRTTRQTAGVLRGPEASACLRWLTVVCRKPPRIKHPPVFGNSPRDGQHYHSIPPLCCHERNCTRKNKTCETNSLHFFEFVQTGEKPLRYFRQLRNMVQPSVRCLGACFQGRRTRAMRTSHRVLSG